MCRERVFYIVGRWNKVEQAGQRAEEQQETQVVWEKMVDGEVRRSSHSARDTEAV